MMENLTEREINVLSVAIGLAATILLQLITL